MDACEYVTRATRERLISFLFLANKACQQLPAPNPRGQKRKHKKRGCIFRHVPGLRVSAPTSGRILLLSVTSMVSAEALRQGKKRPRERPLPPGWRRDKGRKGFFHSGSPQLFPSPEGEAPLPPHSISPTHSEWCWPIEGFPTPVPWVTREKPEGWGGGSRRGIRLRLPGTDTERTELHIWP